MAGCGRRHAPRPSAPPRRRRRPGAPADTVRAVTASAEGGQVTSRRHPRRAVTDNPRRRPGSEVSATLRVGGVGAAPGRSSTEGHLLVSGETSSTAKTNLAGIYVQRNIYVPLCSSRSATETTEDSESSRHLKTVQAAKEADAWHCFDVLLDTARVWHSVKVVLWGELAP